MNGVDAVTLSRSLRHRLARRRTVPWMWAAIPVVSPYADRLRDAAMDGHHCHWFAVPMESER